MHTWLVLAHIPSGLVAAGAVVHPERQVPPLVEPPERCVRRVLARQQGAGLGRLGLRPGLRPDPLPGAGLDDLSLARDQEVQRIWPAGAAHGDAHISE